MARSQHGKKIETWEFNTSFGKVQAPLYLKTGQHGDMLFTVDIEVEGQRFWESGKVPDDLRKSLQKWLNGLQIEWSPHLLVKIAWRKHESSVDAPEEGDEEDGFPDIDRFAGEVALSLSWSRCWIGTRADGQEMHRSRRLGGKAFTGRPDTGFEESDFSEHWNPSQTALVPDTPEMRASLLQLARTIRATREQLQKLLAPEAAQKFLLGLQKNGGPLLLGAAMAEPLKTKKPKK